MTKLCGEYLNLRDHAHMFCSAFQVLFSVKAVSVLIDNFNTEDAESEK